MPTPKRHHFIPEFVLKNFADRNGRLWFHRPDFGTEVRPTAPKNLFVEGNLNTIFEENGERDLRIEALFGRLESAAGEMFPPILEAARRGNSIRLSDSAWDLWDNYMYYQMKRVPAAIKRAELAVDVKAFMSQVIAEEEEAGRLDAATKAELLSDSGLSMLRHNAMASSRISRPSPKLWKLIRSCGLDIYVVARPDAGEFLVGDVGMVPPSVALARFFTAIAPDVAFVQTFRERTVNVWHLRDRAHIRRLNIETARASETIAGRNPELVRFIASRRGR